MIFGNINDEKIYEILPDELKKCIDYFKNHDLASYEQGSHKIEGDNFFVNIENYTTVARKDRFWEGHRKYIDVHMMIEGYEIIDTNFTARMNIENYDESRDFVAMNGEESSRVKLTQKGDFLICYPEDAHRTAIICDKAIKLKKAIFKVKL